MQTFKKIKFDMPEKIKALKYKKHIFLGVIIAVSALLGLNSAPGFAGFMLQSGAIFSGVIIGLFIRKDISSEFITAFYSLLVALLVFMQPEFFRFGQLGNLTIVHIVSVVALVMITSVLLSVKLVSPKSFLSNGLYSKIKWMGRLFVLFLFIFFMLTESVFILVALALGMLVLFMLSVAHQNKVKPNLSESMWFFMLMALGVVTSMTALTAFAVLGFAMMKNPVKFKDLKFLL